MYELCQHYGPRDVGDLPVAITGQLIETDANNETDERLKRENETETLEASPDRSTSVVWEQVDEDADAEAHFDTLQTSVEKDVSPVDTQENLHQAVAQICNTLMQEPSNAGTQAARKQLQDLSERLEFCEKDLALLQFGGKHKCQEAENEIHSVRSEINGVNEAIQECREYLSTNYKYCQLHQSNINSRLASLEQSVTDRLVGLEKGVLERMDDVNSRINRME
ncbi:hypothetical protein FSARC_2593 [Fusarium sarcochroum]|uniref:Uncharacterized protein n=1 Tax=Fusarium sarcochroum TaxID=1208366 RepID=A0A8H4XCU4_9HYPO|nr:hypothetical protein FSARC_2593 [Fusarium sarcochroum]